MAERADLDTLRKMTGAKTTTDEAAMSVCLDSARAWVAGRVRTDAATAPEVYQATLMLAARLYKRRLSPEGVSGWDDLGVVRVLARDPDIERLLEQHIDAYQVWGVA